MNKIRFIGSTIIAFAVCYLSYLFLVKGFGLEVESWPMVLFYYGAIMVAMIMNSTAFKDE